MCEGAVAGHEHAALMCPARLHSHTASVPSLRSAIILSAVWPPPSTPAGMPAPLPKSLLQNVNASKTERVHWAGWSSFCHKGREHVITGLWAAAEHVSKRNASVDFSYLPLYVMPFGGTHRLFYTIIIHTCKSTRTRKEMHTCYKLHLVEENHPLLRFKIPGQGPMRLCNCRSPGIQLVRGLANGRLQASSPPPALWAITLISLCWREVSGNAHTQIRALKLQENIGGHRPYAQMYIQYNIQGT